MALTKIKGSSLSSDALSDIRTNVSSVPLTDLSLSGNLIASGGITLGTSVGVYNVAKTMDDYEEGTFVGTLRMHSNPADVSTTNTGITSTGNYIKVGNLVQFDIYFDVQSYSNYVAKEILGLPFVSSNSGSGQPVSMGHQRGIRFVYSGTILGDMLLSATVTPNTTNVSLAASATGNAFSGWYYISNEPAQGKYIHIGGAYRSQ